MKALMLLILTMSNLAHSKAEDKCAVFKAHLANFVVNKKAFNVSDLEKCVLTNDIPNSSYYLGLIYIHGLNTKKDYKKGVTYLFNSAQKGNINSLAALGELYIIDDDKKIFNQGVILLELAAEKGNTEAIIKLYSLMHLQKIPFSEALANRFKGLIQANNDKAILYSLELAISKAIEQDNESEIKKFISALNFSEIGKETLGEIHYLLARAYISEETSFYSISKVKVELEKASEFGHQHAQKLLTGVKKIEQQRK